MILLVSKTLRFKSCLHLVNLSVFYNCSYKITTLYAFFDLSILNNACQLLCRANEPAGLKLVNKSARDPCVYPFAVDAA